MLIELDEIQIRPWRKDDAEGIVKYANNRKIWKNVRDAFPHPYTLEDAKAFIEKALSADPVTFFAIANQFEVIGSIGLGLGQDVHRYSAEMGYWLAEPYWGKGIMTKAVKAFAEWSMEEYKLIRIFSEPFVTNIASLKVLEKAGFQKEGIMRANVVKENQIIDQYLCSFVRDQFIPERL